MSNLQDFPSQVNTRTVPSLVNPELFNVEQCAGCDEPFEDFAALLRIDCDLFGDRQIVPLCFDCFKHLFFPDEITDDGWLKAAMIEVGMVGYMTLQREKLKSQVVNQ